MDTFRLYLDKWDGNNAAYNLNLNIMTKTEIKNRLRNLEHLKGFEVSYKSATDYNGSSIKITDTRFNKSIRVPYDYYYNTAWEIAADYLITKNKINITGFCWNEHKGTYTLLTDDFSTELVKV